MNPTWQYPIYLIPHGGGYASIVDPEATQSPAHHLVVYGETRMASQFMADFNILGEPRPINNDREFLWLLQALRAPVTEVSFDPRPNDDGINANWSASVRELMESHLTIEYSPWNYPVYVVALEVGFVCIRGQSNDGRELTAIGVFDNEENAHAYLEKTNRSGTTCKLSNVDEANQFLSGLDEEVAAVAFDPVVDEDRHSAKHCFDLQTLLSKYLVKAGNHT